MVFIELCIGLFWWNKLPEEDERPFSDCQVVLNLGVWAWWTLYSKEEFTAKGCVSLNDQDLLFISELKSLSKFGIPAIDPGRLCLIFLSCCLKPGKDNCLISLSLGFTRISLKSIPLVVSREDTVLLLQLSWCMSLQCVFEWSGKWLPLASDASTNSNPLWILLTVPFV